MENYMNTILNTIKNVILENRKIYLPHVKDEELEENGAVYYMNGKNGTEFDWYVNEKLSDFFVFYDDENCMGAVKLTLYNNGALRIYLYDEHGSKLIKEFKTFTEVPEKEILKLAVFLRYEMDDRKIWDANIDDIDYTKDITVDQIREFQGNECFYQDMINRKKLYGMFCYVSTKITDEGWKVGYMVREEAEREEDSGWSFMAGNEDDEFIEDYKNIKLLSIAEMCRMAPEIQEHIDKPVGTALIRVSSDRLEVDKNDREIYVEKQ